jgi:hypothetical protein
VLHGSYSTIYLAINVTGLYESKISTSTSTSPSRSRLRRPAAILVGCETQFTRAAIFVALASRAFPFKPVRIPHLVLSQFHLFQTPRIAKLRYPDIQPQFKQLPALSNQNSRYNPTWNPSSRPLKEMNTSFSMPLVEASLKLSYPATRPKLRDGQLPMERDTARLCNCGQRLSATWNSARTSLPAL